MSITVLNVTRYKASANQIEKSAGQKPGRTEPL